MKCEFWMTGTFGVCDHEEDVYHVFSHMEDAVDFVQEIWVDGCGFEVDVIDMTTGEILLHFEDDDPESEPEPDDCDFEMGFNPYLGDFDWDC